MAARTAVVFVLVAVVASCSDRPVPTAGQETALQTARDRVERCVSGRLAAMGGVTPAAPRALARSLSVACRTQRDAFESMAVSIRGDDGAEEEVTALEAWIFRAAEDQALNQSRSRPFGGRAN